MHHRATGRKARSAESSSALAASPAKSSARKPPSTTSISPAAQLIENDRKRMVQQLREFRANCKDLVEFITTFDENIEKKNVFTDLKPGYLKNMIPDEQPADEPISFASQLKDFQTKIVPGSLLWKHPHFFAYFPAGGSYGNCLGDMLCTAFGGIGFEWALQPSLVELENVMLDWLCVALQMPDQFHSGKSEGVGGASVQGGASECIHNAIMAARYRQIKRNRINHGWSMVKSLSKMMAYASSEAHSSVPKGCDIAMCQMHLLDGENFECKITAKELQRALDDDIGRGYQPFLMVCTVGTTGSGAVDDVEQIGPICKRHDMYLHVDAAYAGACFVLTQERYRHMRKGLQYADSLNMNPYKFLLAAPDLAVLFIRDMSAYQETYKVNEDDCEIGEKNKWELNYRHFGIPETRRMRSLKLWIVFCTYGLKGMQDYVERLCGMARELERCVRADDRFEVTNNVYMALVCFRQKPILRDEGVDNPTYVDSQNTNLIHRLNQTHQIHMVPSNLKHQIILRMSINYEYMTFKHVHDAWKMVQDNYVTKLDAAPDTSTRSSVPSSDIVRVMAASNMTFVSQEQYDLLKKNNLLRSDPYGFTPIPYNDHNASMAEFFVQKKSAAATPKGAVPSSYVEGKIVDDDIASPFLH